MRVGALPIVEHFHVVEDRPSRLLAGLELVAMNELAFQGREEALDDRVIPAVSTPSDAARDLPSTEFLLVVVTRVLRSTIRMMQQLGFRIPLPQRHAESRQHERPSQRISHRPAHNSAREQIHHNSQVKPTSRARAARQVHALVRRHGTATVCQP